MPALDRPLWSRYSGALLMVALGTVARMLLDPVLGVNAVPFITLYASVVAAAWWGGRGAGLFAIAIGLVASTLWIIQPRGEIPHNTAYWAGAALFALMSLVIVALVETTRKAQRDAQKQAAELALQEEWLRVTLASIGDAVIATDVEGRVTLINAVAEQLTGWSARDAAGKPLDAVFNIISEVTGEPVPTPVRRALDAGVVIGLANHTVLISRTGERRAIEDSAAPIRDQAGVVIGVVLVFRDATEERRVRAAERTSAERLGLALEAGRLGVWEWNLVTNEVWWSDNLEAIHGMEPGTFGGTLEAFRGLVHPEDVDLVDALVGAAIVRRSDYSVLFRTITSAGEIRWISGKGKVFLDDDGNPSRMVGISSDVTEQRAIENALLEADRRKDEFLATLAHELRNPLAPIRNALEILRLIEREPDELGHRARVMMERQVAHMTRLLDDLLDVSRITRNRLELRPERVELAAIITSAIETAQQALDAEGRVFTLDLPPEPVWLDADHTRLAQVFANLLNNAAKFTRPGGRITLRAELEGDAVRVVISDDGVGLTQDDIEHIFDLFVQGSRSHAGPASGLGIGLTIARRLAELHGGSLTVSSDGHDRGSEFTVQLPVAPAPAADGVTQRLPWIATPRLSVLIADDNHDAADTLAMMLRLWGHDVRVANDGREALTVAAEFRPDVALLDIGMPELSGYDVARQLRSRDEHCGMMLVAVTGWGQAQDKHEAQAAGFDHHMTKPIDPEQLARLISGGAAR